MQDQEKLKKDGLSRPLITMKMGCEEDLRERKEF